MLHRGPVLGVQELGALRKHRDGDVEALALRPNARRVGAVLEMRARA
jgi:hypothetical protein